jgi:uncharacterized delta-60 repeat protein
MRPVLARIISALVLTMTTVLTLQTSEAHASVPTPFDSTFGTNGRAIHELPFQKSITYVSDTIQDASGNIYALIVANPNSGNDIVTIAKYSSSGAAVSQFGTSGRTAELKMTGANFALQSDGKIVIAGYERKDRQDSIAVYRYNTNGQIDSTFNSSGVNRISEFPGKSFFKDEVFILIEPNANEIHLGFHVRNSDFSNLNLYFIKLRSNGRLDTQWGRDGGQEVVPVAGGASAWSTMTSIVSVYGGAIIAIGSSIPSSGVRQITLIKLDNDGYLDSQYDGASNGNGIVFVQFASESDAVMSAVTVLQNDDLVLAGSAGTYFNGPWYYGATKILADGTVDTSFGTNGFALSAVQPPAQDPLPKRIGVQSDGRFVFPINSGTTAGFMRVETNGTFSNTPNCSQCLWSGANDGAKAYSLVVQSDSKIVVVGALRTAKDAIVRRFSASGTADGTFTNVVVQLTLEKWWSNIYHGLALPDGSTIGVGLASTQRENDEPSRVLIMKFTPNGTLDTAFGLNGYQFLAPPNDQYWLSVRGIVRQTDQKIVILANGRDNSVLNSLLLWRINADGTLDNTFGTNGSVIASDVTYNLGASDLLLTNDGKLVVPISRATNYNDNGILWLYRFTSTGQLDSSFTDAENFAGGIKPNIGDGTGFFNSSLLTSNGNFYVSGMTTVNNTRTIFVSRFLANGNLDSSFSGGTVTWPNQDPNLPNYVAKILIDSQSRVVLVGETSGQTNTSAVVRLTSSGVLDTSFNSTGYNNFSFQNPAQIDSEYPTDFFPFGNGYVVIGSGDSDSTAFSVVNYSGLARVGSSGALDQSFGTNGILLPFAPSQTRLTRAVPLSDGSVVVFGEILQDGEEKILVSKLISPTAPQTTAPVLQTPTNASQFELTPSAFTMTGSFPDTVMSGSIRITLATTSNGGATRTISVTDRQSLNVTFDPLAPHAGIVSNSWASAVTTTIAGASSPSTRMPDGTYTVSIAYQSVTGGPVATATATNVVFRSKCPPGTFSSTTFVPCTPASAGSYQNLYGATSSISCPPGSFQPDTNSLSCIWAPRGHYVDSSGQSSAIPAPPGRYVSVQGATSAALCDAGSYQPNAGSISCIWAPRGHYVGSSGQTSSTPAAPGQYVSIEGAVVATTCEPGTYQPDAGSSNCLDAAPNHFVSVQGSSSQLACPTGFHAPNARSTSCIALSQSAPTTAPPVAAPPTSVPTVEAQDDTKLVITVSQATVLSRLQIAVPRGGKVAMVSRTPRVCRIARNRVQATSTGTCRVAVTVTDKKKKTTRTLALRVS